MSWLDNLNNIVSFCETLSRKVLDDNGKKNIHDASAAGLETRVVRSYDDVGLHDGKDECKWCKSREGDWSYKEAIRNGVFERHPGCECTIDYVTSKGAQRQTNWRDNTWEDARDPDTLGMRQRYWVDNEDLSANERIAIQEAAQSPGDAVKPQSMYGDFYDFKDIDIDNDTKESMSELGSLAKDTGWEHGRSKCDGVWLEPHTDNKHNDVAIPYLTDAKNVELYHSHTDESPPSAEDLRAFVTPSIQRIGVISGNGDGWIIDIGQGMRPTKKELDEVMDSCYNQAKENLQGDPNFFDWSFEERMYMLVRERMRLVANYFEWDVMGGVLNE